MFLKQQVHLFGACEGSGHGSHSRGRIAGVHSTDGSTAWESWAPGGAHVLEPQAPSSFWALGTQIRASPYPVLLLQDSQCLSGAACAPPSFPWQLLRLSNLQKSICQGTEVGTSCSSMESITRQLLPQTISKSPNFQYAFDIQCAVSCNRWMTKKAAKILCIAKQY